MSYKNPTGPQKFKKKDTDQLSEKRKLQMGITKEIYPVSNKDIAFLKKNMPKIKSKKKLKR